MRELSLDAGNIIINPPKTANTEVVSGLFVNRLVQGQMPSQFNSVETSNVCLSTVLKQCAGDFGEFGADASFEGDVGVHSLAFHSVDDVGQAVGH